MVYCKHVFLEYLSVHGRCENCGNTELPMITEELSERNANIRERAIVASKYRELGCTAELPLDEVEEYEANCLKWDEATEQWVVHSKLFHHLSKGKFPDGSDEKY